MFCRLIILYEVFIIKFIEFNGFLGFKGIRVYLVKILL